MLIKMHAMTLLPSPRISSKSKSARQGRPNPAEGRQNFADLGLFLGRQCRSELLYKNLIKFIVEVWNR